MLIYYKGQATVQHLCNFASIYTIIFLVICTSNNIHESIQSLKNLASSIAFGNYSNYDYLAQTVRHIYPVQSKQLH